MRVSRVDCVPGVPSRMATVPLVDAPSSRRADNSYDVDAGREARRARRQRSRRDNTLALPRRIFEPWQP